MSLLTLFQKLSGGLVGRPVRNRMRKRSQYALCSVRHAHTTNTNEGAGEGEQTFKLACDAEGVESCGEEGQHENGAGDAQSNDRSLAGAPGGQAESQRCSGVLA